MNTETTANATTPASTCGERDVEQRRRGEHGHREQEEIRRPSVSATTPVGTSNTTIPAENAAFATNTSKKLRPASSRNSVLTPQMSAADKV